MNEFGHERLVAAYEQTLRALRLKDRDDPITQLVAEKIIAIGRLEIEDPAEISKLALKELGCDRAVRLDRLIACSPQSSAGRQGPDRQGGYVGGDCEPAAARDITAALALAHAGVENFGRTSAPRLPQAVHAKSGSISDSRT